MNIQIEKLQKHAARVGTPYWYVDAGLLRERIAQMKAVAAAGGANLRYAMKALSCTPVLNEMHRAGVWIDCVSGNEVRRALRAGFPAGCTPPVIQLTADVFRDGALRTVVENKILVNIGSPAMVAQLKAARWQGPVAVRVNPGFGHGHVNACDTGGPSSKHGIWPDALPATIAACREAGFPIIMLHAHVGTGPEVEEFYANLRRLGEYFASLAPQLPDLHAFSVGGGLPFNYHEDEPEIDYMPMVPVLQDIKAMLCAATGRNITLELEPGRAFVAPCATLVTRVTDVKYTNDNEKGQGQTFVMVDAGFVDLVRPAMYGSYHRISIHTKNETPEWVPLNVAGPLCESGDVFTRDEHELLAPRVLPKPEPGDLVLIHDVGAYGYCMSSNYNSVGRAPTIWSDPNSKHDTMITRRETVEDILNLECAVKL